MSLLIMRMMNHKHNDQHPVGTNQEYQELGQDPVVGHMKQMKSLKNILKRRNKFRKSPDDQQQDLEVGAELDLLDRDQALGEIQIRLVQVGSHLVHPVQDHPNSNLPDQAEDPEIDFLQE